MKYIKGKSYRLYNYAAINLKDDGIIILIVVIDLWDLLFIHYSFPDAAGCMSWLGFANEDLKARSHRANFAGAFLER